MPRRKLKPIEERDPYAALVLDAWDRLEHGEPQLSELESQPKRRPALQLVGGRKVAPKSVQGGWGAPDFTGFISGLVTIGVLIGIALTLVVPWLWEQIKPFIHAVTA